MRGGVKEETTKERARLFAGLESFMEELLLSAEGRAVFSKLWSMYFWTLDKKTLREVKRPKVGYKRKIK